MGVGDRLVPATVFVVLGFGFVAMALDFDWFWWVWVIGYAVVLPLVAVLTGPGAPPHPGGDASGHRDDAGSTRDVESNGDAESTRDELDRLRERYARGELTDAAFERKVEWLVGTETRENADPADADARENGASGSAPSKSRREREQE